MKIMIIGNSHSVDTFWLLHNVFADQMPDQDIQLGILYYGGCTVTKHVRFANENQNAYHYYYNADGIWNTTKEATMEVGLCDQPWDLIVFQSGRRDGENEYNLAGRRALEQIVKDRLTQPYKMMWHITWPSPDDPIFYTPDYPVQPSPGWVEYLQSNYNRDTFKQFKVMLERANPYLLEDQTYEKVISTGAGIMNAHADLNVPQTALWRDYTHLSDFGRLIAAYTFYAQLTGNPVTKINMDAIPTSLRLSRFRAEGDLVITEEMKQVIISAANKALQDPWTAPTRPAAKEA